MSTVAKTPNYGLSQVSGSDIPDWRTDYTGDMLKIDTALKENAAAIAKSRPDAYSSVKTYAVGAYCIHDNTMYKCKTAITEAMEWNVSYWEETSITDELSELTENMSFMGNNYSETTSLVLVNGWNYNKKISFSKTIPAGKYIIFLSHECDVASANSVITASIQGGTGALTAWRSDANYAKISAPIFYSSSEGFDSVICDIYQSISNSVAHKFEICAIRIS